MNVNSPYYSNFRPPLTKYKEWFNELMFALSPRIQKKHYIRVVSLLNLKKTIVILDYVRLGIIRSRCICVYKWSLVWYTYVSICAHASCIVYHALDNRTIALSRVISDMHRHGSCYTVYVNWLECVHSLYNILTNSIVCFFANQNNN